MHDWTAREGTWFVNNIELIVIRQAPVCASPDPEQDRYHNPGKSVPQVAS
jgi:hypothetical protein